MPRLLTMSTVVQRAQRRGDNEFNAQIDSSVGGEWYALASEQYGELVALVAETGMRYFDKAQSFTTDGTNVLAQPSDHYETIGLDHILNATTGQRRALREMMAQDRARWSGLTGDAVAYELVTASFLLYPTPPAGQTYELRYVPQAPDLTLLVGASTIDVINPAGEAFLIWGMAVKSMAKTNDDPSGAIAERDRHAEQLVAWATERALNEPRRRVVRGELDLWDCDDAGDPAGWWNRR